MIKWKKIKGEDAVAEGNSGVFRFRIGVTGGGWWLMVYQEGAGYEPVFDKYSMPDMAAAKKNCQEFLDKVLGG